MASAVAVLPQAEATEGQFALGYGVAQRSTGGAGVAQATDAMSAAINPATAADIGREFQVGIEFFAPFRGYEASGTILVAPGDVRSDRNLFFIPNLAYNHPIDENSAINFSIYGNGGQNTDYGDVLNLAPGCGGFSPGVFCGGKAGVDLMQVFISATYAYDFGNVAIGIAPTLAVQSFEATGLGVFAPFSSNPLALTNNGHEMSFGGGLRAGVLVDVTENVRIGLSGQTKMWMQKFDSYAGLFANQGEFDIPPSVSAGIAVDVVDDLTLMFDYQRIFYTDVDAIGNPFFPAPLGSSDGPGFGWDDVDVFKVGVEWRQNDRFTWRAGYAFATNPIGSDDVTLNVIAPGLVEHHLTGGGNIKVTERDSIDFGLLYAFSNSVTGPEVTPFGVTPGSSIEIEMHQFSASVGWKRTF